MGKTVALTLLPLPNCPVGSMFKEDINGDYYHYMTDEESIRGTRIIYGREYPIKNYKFTKEEVKSNEDFFEVDDASWYRNGEDKFVCPHCNIGYAESSLEQEETNEGRSFSEELFYPCCGTVVE